MTLNEQEIATVLLVYNDAINSGSLDPNEMTPEELIFEVEVELDEPLVINKESR